MFQMADASDTWELTPEYTIGLNETLLYRGGEFAILKANDPDAESFRDFQTKLFNLMESQLGGILNETKITNLHLEQMTGCEFTEEDLL